MGYRTAHLKEQVGIFCLRLPQAGIQFSIEESEASSGPRHSKHCFPELTSGYSPRHLEMKLQRHQSCLFKDLLVADGLGPNYQLDFS